MRHLPPRRRAGSRRSRASPPGCGATTRSRSSPTGCASTTASVADPDRARRLLRPRPLQPVHLDRGGARATSTASIPTPPRVARERYGCLTPWQKRPGRLRPRGADRRATASCESEVVAMLRDLLRERARVQRARRRALLRRRPERARRRQRRALLPRHVLRLARVVEPARPAHVRHPARRCSGFRGPAPRSSSGSTTRTSATPRRPRWARAASTTSASCAAQAFGDGAYLVGFGTDHGTVAAAIALGRADAGHAGAAVARGELRAALPRQRRAGVPAAPARAAARRAARRAHDAAPRARHRRHLSARDRAAEPLLPGRACPHQFDEYVWFDETPAVTPLAVAARRACPRPTRSACESFFSKQSRGPRRLCGANAGFARRLGPRHHCAW